MALSDELGQEPDIRQLEVRPEDASPASKPAYTINVLADRSIPFSTYAKILVDVATAAGQKGGQAFFKNAAQVAIENAMALLDALDWDVTIDNCYYLVTDMTELTKQVENWRKCPILSTVICSIIIASSSNNHRNN